MSVFEELVVKGNAGRDDVDVLPDFVLKRTELPGVKVEVVLSISHSNGKECEHFFNGLRHPNGRERESTSVRVDCSRTTEGFV